jgi:hypothetical protein
MKYQIISRPFTNSSCSIELIPIKPIAHMRGFLKEIGTEVNREGDLVELESISEFS